MSTYYVLIIITERIFAALKILCTLPDYLLPNPWPSLTFSPSVILSCPESHIIRIIQDTAFWNGFFHLVHLFPPCIFMV